MAHYKTIIGGEGPRATPTVVSNRVFGFGATGILNCLDLATGKIVWSRDIVKEFGGKPPQWGATSSPLLVETWSSFMAARAVTRWSHCGPPMAPPVWKSEGCPGYASPIAATLAGVSQILAFNTKTWNPIALSGDLLLVRNDREAVCLRLKLARPVASSL